MSVQMVYRKNVEINVDSVGEATLHIKCRCGTEHSVKLDASGHFNGTLPCDESIATRIQVEPEIWRGLVTRHHNATKH